MKPGLVAALLSGLVVALAGGLAGCAAPPAPVREASAPAPEPATSTAAPSGTPAPVPTTGNCLASDPPMLSLPAPGDMPPGTTLADIQKRGYLIAGVDQDSYDWSYRNPAIDAPVGQAYVGLDIDVLHALAQAIFGNADKIHFVPVTQDFRMGAANQGIVDVVADSITINCARAQQVHFSIDYFNAAQEMLVPQDNTTISVTLDAHRVPHVSGLAGGAVCTVGTTTSVANLTALAKPGGFRVVLAANWSDCLVLLQQGDVQAISTDNTLLGGIAAEDPYLKLAGKPFSYEPHGLAFPLSDPLSAGNAEFISFANAVLLRLESGAGGYCPVPRLSTDSSCWAAMYRVWAQTQLGPVPAPPTPSFTSQEAG